MKRLTAILMALSLAFPAWAAAELDVNMEQKEENGQTLAVFSAVEAGAAETTAAPEETPDPAIATANALIEARFEQTKAAQLTQRWGTSRRSCCDGTAHSRTARREAPCARWCSTGRPARKSAWSSFLTTRMRR